MRTARVLVTGAAGFIGSLRSLPSSWTHLIYSWQTILTASTELTYYALTDK